MNENITTLDWGYSSGSMKSSVLKVIRTVNESVKPKEFIPLKVTSNHTTVLGTMSNKNVILSIIDLGDAITYEEEILRIMDKCIICIFSDKFSVEDNKVDTKYMNILELDSEDLLSIAEKDTDKDLGTIYYTVAPKLLISRMGNLEKTTNLF